MPNVLNISSYKKVGLCLFLRKASSRSRSLEIGNETRAVSEDQTARTQAFILRSVLGRLFSRRLSPTPARGRSGVVGWTCSPEH